MSASALPRTSPSLAGVDAAGLLAFVEALEAAPGIDPHSLMLIRGGSVVAEGWWAPYAADRVHLLYSLSKSFTSTALGLAVAEGLVDLDATVLSYFPELDAEITAPTARALKVRHVAAMAAGHAVDMLEPARDLDPVDLVRGFLLLPPPDDAAGDVFAYSQPCTFTVGAIVQRVSGGSLTGFLRPRLFDPLGIGTVGWQTDASGREIGYSGLHAVTGAVAALGLLYLQGGRWGDRQLLPAAWVQEATRSQVSTAAEGNPDWQQGYGFQFWMARHGYRGDGAYGQFCIVLPEHDTVLAVTAQTADMQSVLDLVWAHVLPALTGAGSAVDDAALAQRLAALAIPPVAGAATAAAAGRTFTAAAGNDQPSLTAVAVTVVDGGWQLELREPAGVLAVGMGIGEWLITGAFAVSGAWSGDDLHVDVIFVETPHRLQLVCGAAGEFTARWMTPPLWDTTLAALRMPG